MKKLNKIQLIESPKEEIQLDNDNMASLLGGLTDYCPATYRDGGIFGGDYCSASFNSGDCGDVTVYCGQYKSCTFLYNY